MKQNPKLSAIVLALALGGAATCSWAQGYSDTYTDPPGATFGNEPQTPMDVQTPSSTEERQMEPMNSGAQGPIRADEDMSGNTLPGLSQGMNSDPFRNPNSARDAPRFGQASSAAERGYEGFLQFQERGTNSP